MTDECTGELKCSNRVAIRYERLERAVLKIALHYTASGSASPSVEVSEAEIEIAESLRHIEEKQRQVDNLVDSFSRTGSPSVERAMLLLEAELTDLKESLVTRQRELQDVLASKPAPDHFTTVARLQEELKSEDAETRTHARVRMKQTLRGILSVMTCGRDKATTVVLGDNVVAITFDDSGNIVENCVLQQRIFGPEGEPDWSPDQALMIG